MGMIDRFIQDIGCQTGFESFESQLGIQIEKIYPIISKSSTISGGYTQVTAISEREIGGVVSFKTRVSLKPLPDLLRRISCRLHSISFLCWVLSGSWLPVRCHHLNRNPSWSRSLKTTYSWANTNKTIAGRITFAQPILSSPGRGSC